VKFNEDLRESAGELRNKLFTCSVITKQAIFTEQLAKVNDMRLERIEHHIDAHDAPQVIDKPAPHQAAEQG